MYIITKENLTNFLTQFQKIFNPILLGLFLFPPYILCGQFQKIETTPPNLKWHYKKSENFKVLFPKNLDSIANYTINYLENNIKNIKISPDFKIRKSPIILHNYNSISNGFVTSAPRRSELFITATPESSHFLHNNNWVDLLSTHEYRHLVQKEIAFRKPFNKMIYVLFGELAFSSVSRATMPLWYWEGDAVDIETRNSTFGRGRIPYFNLISRNNLMGGKKIKLNTQLLGSFKTKTPNIYESGYLMVKYLKDTFGIETFNKIVNKAQSQSMLPLSFSRALKKETNLNFKSLYLKSLNTLTVASTKTTNEPINKRKKNNYTSYLYPKESDDGSVFFLQQGLGSFQYFGKINKDGSTSNVFMPGLINDHGRISSTKNKLVWLEFDKDPRWDKRVYSIIKILDIKEKKIISKSKKTYFSSVDISKDGEKLVALSNNPNGTQSLVFLNVEGCIKTNEINLKNGVYSNIRFSEKNTLIGIKNNNGIKHLFIYSINENKFDAFFKTNQNIGQPTQYGNLIAFNSDVDGVDEIILYNIKSKKTFMLKGGVLGNYYPSFSVDGEFLLFNSMTPKGFNVFKLKIKENIKEIKFSSFCVSCPVVDFKTKEKDKASFQYESKKLEKPFTLIRPITWGINNFSSSSKGLDDMSFGVTSQDVFGSLQFNGGYKYNFRDKKGEKFFGLSYQGLYPIFDFNLALKNETSQISNNDNLYDVFWKEKDMTFGIRIPLSFTNSKYFTNFLTSIEYSNSKVYDFIAPTFNGTVNITKDFMGHYDIFVYYSRLHKKTKRQVSSPWGQAILFESKKTISSSDFSGRYFRSDIYLDFPGINTTHSLRTKFRYENQDNNDYMFHEKINFIHGYQNDGVFKNFYGWGVEYELPIVYPDISVGPLINIQRIRYTSFINGGQIKGKKNTFPYISFKENPISFGGEITFDINLFRQSALFDLGLRWSYITNTLNGKNNLVFELMLGSIGL